jgi:hypothetical protein
MFFLREKVVKPYLLNLKTNWNPSNGETWDNFMNGWLPTEGIQAIPNHIEKIIILIYLDSSAVQIFFPNFNNNNNTFFIKENELETCTFREIVKRRGYDINLIETTFKTVDISLDLTMIDFLKKLFEFSGII